MELICFGCGQKFCGDSKKECEACERLMAQIEAEAEFDRKVERMEAASREDWSLDLDHRESDWY